ncbi:hypothetical protein C6558_37900 [Ensifer sp. NM-2]|uniref:NAD-dependent epimerase/dehydratase family protein n=1 Tax=Ensifer sp. NM-2 TaxID=2109730 RepID=UPI000D118CF9|nr:NAD-dependent epimerase/dehydratase family protein [Ensifer sp. NM-2]PSS59509.1 hypothetical protein C6558_37900 [Ensifer sp. NM-2]
MHIRANNILVAGGRGFIGSHVVRQLLSRGANVCVLDVAPANQFHSRLKWIQSSFDNEQVVQEALSDCDSVVYLVASSLPATQATPEDEIVGQVLTPVKFAERCATSGVKRFIFASSGGTVYGDGGTPPYTEHSSCQPRNLYGVSKLACEHYLRIIGLTTSMTTCSLRISNPYGEGQVARQGQGFVAAAIEKAIRDEPMIIWGDGSAVRDFVYVEDVAKAAVLACFSDSRAPTINVGSGRGVALSEVLDAVSEVHGKPLSLVFEPNRNVDVAVNVLDIALASSELGWQPGVSLREGVEMTYRWWLTSQA